MRLSTFVFASMLTASSLATLSGSVLAAERPTKYLDKVALKKLLQKNAAVAGAISLSHKPEKCGTLTIDKLSADGEFKASVQCETPGDEDDGGGVTTSINITGEIMGGAILLKNISFEHAG